MSVLGCFIALSACDTKPIEITSKPLEKPILTLPSLDTIQLKEVTWVILTKENFEEEVAKLPDGVVFFAMNTKSYENLSLNLNDLRSYIQGQQTIIAAYNKYYVKSSNIIDNANNNK